MIATSNSKVECGKIFSCIILMKAEESSKSLSFLTYEMRMTLVLVALLALPGQPIACELRQEFLLQRPAKLDVDLTGVPSPNGRTL